MHSRLKSSKLGHLEPFAAALACYLSGHALNTYVALAAWIGVEFVLPGLQLHLLVGTGIPL